MTAYFNCKYPYYRFRWAKQERETGPLFLAGLIMSQNPTEPFDIDADLIQQQREENERLKEKLKRKRAGLPPLRIRTIRLKYIPRLVNA